MLKRFEDPDEIRRFEKGVFEIVRVGGLTIGRATYEPGWKWSEHDSANTEVPTMPRSMEQVTVDTLQDFADAWNRHDVDSLMTFMTEDCVFESSTGPEVSGSRYVGYEAVRVGFADVFATFPDAHWGDARHFVCGERGVSEWTFTGSRADGTRVEVHGCDLFRFRDGKIALKDSFRKNRVPGSS